MMNEANSNGRVFVEDIMDYFIDFYEDRMKKGIVVEKKTSLYCKKGYTKKEAEKNIFTNPFKRFEDMRFVKISKELEYVEFNKNIWKKLSEEEGGGFRNVATDRWRSIIEEYLKKNISETKGRQYINTLVETSIFYCAKQSTLKS